MKIHLATIACAGLLLAACAPDAWRPSPQYNAFLTHLQRACAGQKIGPSSRVDNLIKRSDSSTGSYFVDQTSRLYAGKISPESWATGVSAFLNGWPSDPGVQCTLRETNKYKATHGPYQNPKAPSSAPPK